MYVSGEPRPACAGRAAIYVRLSKEDEEKVSGRDESESIRNQKVMLEDYAREHNYEITGIYADDDESGLYDCRPEFERMIRDAREGRFDIVLAKNQARFSRNMEHIERYLHSEFPRLGVRFIGVADGTDTESCGNKKTRQINGLVNEWYCEELSENIRKVLQTKMRHGEYIGGTAPYGYIVDPQDRNHLVIDPYAAGVVRRIFHLYIQGNGKSRIASILTGEGILIPTLYKQKVLGLNYKNARLKSEVPVWSFQTVHSILNNEVYTGNMVQHRCEKISYKSKARKQVPKEQWIRKPETHDAVISEQVWNAAQEQMKRRTCSLDCTPAGIYSGKVICADCGRSMSRQFQRRADNGSRRTAVGFVCSTYKKCGKSRCSSHAVSFSVLDQAVMKSLKMLLRTGLSDSDREELLNYLPPEEERGNSEDIVNMVRQRIDRVGYYKRKLFEEYSDGVFSREVFAEYLAVYEKEEQELRAGLCAVQSESGASKQGREAFCAWRTKFFRDMILESPDRETVAELIDKIYICSDRHIRIHYRFPDPFPETEQVSLMKGSMCCDGGIHMRQ